VEAEAMAIKVGDESAADQRDPRRCLRRHARFL